MTIRVLVGDSVYEDAVLTIRDGRMFIEFESPDLDSISFEWPYPLEQGHSGSSPHGPASHTSSS